jgi:hypothetical protein
MGIGIGLYMADNGIELFNPILDHSDIGLNFDVEYWVG